MRESRRRFIVGGASAIALLGLSAARAESDAELYAAAKKEGVINWYTGLLQNQIVRPLIAGFESKYPGLRVAVVGGRDTDLLVKITTEVKARKLQADLIDGPSMAGEVIQAGLAAPYAPANGANVPAQFKDPNGFWTAPTLFFITAAVNSNLVKAGQEPKTPDDLLDPKWRGKMAWSGEMSTAGPVGFIGAILNTLGEEQGKAYLRKLAAQRISTIPSNPRVVLDQVITGEYAIGLAIYNHHAVASSAKGAPVRWIAMEPMVATMARSVLLKGAPHPNGAKLLINYLLSPAGQQVFRDAGYIPSVSTVQPKDPTLKLDSARHKVFAPTPAEELRNMKQWVGLYKELFQ
jgi:iron(III) transport system substrate-binding protein